MKRILASFSLLLPLLYVQQVYAKLNVVTTTQDIAAITQAIGSNHVDVFSLTPGTRDPHYAEAKPSMIRRVYKADALFLIGAEMEVGWLPAVLRSARNSKIQASGKGHLDLSQHVEILGIPSDPVDRSMGDVHAAGNPHYWLDPQNGIRMARAITDKLVVLDPSNKKDYESGFSNFESQMTQKTAQWKTRLGFLSKQNMIAYHTSLLYLANAFDFTILKEVEPKPGIAPSAAHLAQLVQTIKQHNIKYLLMEPYYETRSAGFLARKTGIKLVVIPQSVGARPNILNYDQLFDGIVEAFEETK